MAHTGYYSELSSFNNVDLALQQAQLYRDEAGVSATDAAASAAAAAASEADVAANAASSFDNAAAATVSATNAAASENAASASAVSASSSATTATTQATTATAQAALATAKATSATASEAAALTSKNDAATSASAAATSATSASGSASTATTQASSASTSASSATTSASTATTQATNASNSATAAAASATSAASSASTASTQATNAAYSASTVAGAALPMFTVIWWPQRTSIPAGFVPGDGQTLTRATYPDAWDGINAGNVPKAASDAAWLATNTERGKYSVGNGTTTFRVPDYNGKSSGTIGAPFLRGDGALADAVTGVIQRDAIQNLTGDFITRGNPTVAVGGALTGSTGVFETLIQSGSSAASQSFGAAALMDVTTFDASRQARTATENRPLNVTGCYIIKLFGSVINVGSADAAQLATDLAAMSTVANSAYQKTTIVGTVSQAAGVPTGKIVETGTNGNGTYTKFADGTMYCWKVQVINAAVTTTAGAVFVSAALDGGDWPAAFIAKPARLITTDGGSWVWASGTGWSATAVGNFQVARYVSTAATNWSCSILGCGRWF